jgi:phosphatidylinositol-3-phosphatase
MTRRLLLLAALMLTALVTIAVAGTSTSAGASAKGHVKNFKHVFIIMMENTGFDSLLGNPNAPWINQAMQTYGVAGNYFGVTHPSQPNYVAATAGTTAGVPDDNDVTVNEQNIVDQLEAKKHTWKAYMQSLSLCGGNKLAHACGNQLYERKHNPFVSFTDVQTNPARMANIVDLTQLDTDLASKDGKAVPDYSWISPDQCNDMHGRGGGGSSDPCDFSNEQLLIKAGDTFLQNEVGKITASKAWDDNSVIFIAWDESDFTGSGPFGFGDTRGCCDANPGGGHVLALVINHNSDGPSGSFQLYNHYSLLSTVENGWNLGCLAFTCDTANVKPMTDLAGDG